MTTRELRATVYGARASLPNPSVSTKRYGGATTCLGLETPDRIPLVVDGGSGLFDLGLKFFAPRGGPQEVHMFFTHTHWDHVLGLPFFIPFYDESWTIHIYSLGERRASLGDIFSGVYAQRYFPVRFEHLDATVHFHELDFEDRVVIGGTSFRCCRVNHPGYALGFRIEHGGRTLFFASDASPFTEMLFGDRFHLRERDTDPAVLKEMASLERKVVDCARGVDVMFHDANYTDEEYENLFHYGHASLGQAYDLAARCGVRRLVLWHHDRRRRDEEIDAISASTIERGRREGILVEPASQGTTYHLRLDDASIYTTRRGWGQDS